MDLPEYIARVGDAAFAAVVGITERTAMSYRLRQRQPRPKVARKIIELTPVTWSGIYDTTEKVG